MSQNRTRRIVCVMVTHSLLVAVAILGISCTQIETGDTPPRRKVAETRKPAARKTPPRRGVRTLPRTGAKTPARTPEDLSSTFPLPADPLYHVALPARFTADRILVEKSLRRLSLMRDGRTVKRYRIALGLNPTGDKEQEGDRRTPEGVYTIDRHNPASDWHYSLHISYPSAADRASARRRGVSPGGDIMIHGLAPRYAHWGLAHAKSDWTWGCIALSNPEMDELRRSVPTGTVIEIRP